MAIRAARSPDYQNHPAIEPARGDEAGLAIIETFILERGSLVAVENELCVSEIELPFLKGYCPLRRIEGHDHRPLCSYIMGVVKI